MSLKVISEREPTDEEIQKALEVRCSPCFMAMNIANAVAGRETVIWKIVREYTILEILMEVQERNLDIALWKVDVEDTLLIESKAYKSIKEKLNASTI